MLTLTTDFGPSEYVAQMNAAICEVAMNEASAAAELGAKAGDVIEIRGSVA